MTPEQEHQPAGGRDQPRAKKPYQTPRLTVHGTVAELTGAKPSNVPKDASMSA